jgi:microcin C transport system permease protein
MTPLNQRRLANFRANRRGWWSLWIFTVLFVVTLFAELIANDRPLVARVDDRWFVPVLVDYAESDIIEDGLPTEADWHDPFLVEEVAARGWMIWPPVPYSYASVVRDLGVPAPAAMPSTEATMVRVKPNSTEMRKP